MSAQSFMPGFNQKIFSQKRFKIFFLGIFLTQMQLLLAQANYNGPAHIKAIIVENGTTIWSNDGSSRYGEQPTEAVKVYIHDGKLDLQLGTFPMKPIFVDYLNQFESPMLRVWLNTGDGFHLYKEQLLDVEQDLFLIAATTSQGSEANKTFAPIVRSKKATEERINKKINKSVNGFESPKDRQKDEFDQRKDKDGKIAHDALINAKRQADAMRSIRPRDAAIAEWEWLGPGNIGGRIRAIAIRPDNPNIIFIGAASGGIWRSTDGGQNWQVIDDFLPSLAITSLVMNPLNPDIMYASTGEGFGNFDGFPGAGIFKSTNGGLNWQQLPSTSGTNFQWVTRLAIHPADTNVIFAAANGSGFGIIWRSENGGNSWINTLNVAGQRALDIKINPTNNAQIMVGFNNQVYISNNNGISGSWTLLSDDAANRLPSGHGRPEIAFSPSNPSRIYVSLARNFGEIWRSDNGGVNWNLINSGTNYCNGSQNNCANCSNQCWYDNTIWVNPQDDNFILVGGIDMFRSTNGGNTLTKISRWQDSFNFGADNSLHADHHIIVEHPNFDNNQNRTVYFGNDGGIHRTDNVANVSMNAGWVNLVNNLGITQFYAGAASPDGNFIIGGTQDNSSIHYTNNGGTEQWWASFTGDGGHCGVDYTNPGIIYATSQNLNVYKSTDAGQTYALSNNGLLDAGNPNQAAFIAPMALDPNNPQNLVAGGISVWRTTDGAGNWNEIRIPETDSSFTSAIAITPGNSERILVGYRNGNLAVTPNAGSGWLRIDNTLTNPLPDRWITDIAINPNNPSVIMVSLGGYNNDNLYLTTNAGQSWQRITGQGIHQLPAVHINTITFHPGNPNWIYVGTDIGLFASEDLGQTWSTDPLNANHEAPANVRVNDLFWAGNQLIAATHGRGMYKARPLEYIYVDGNASPGGDGTFNNPFRTVTEALNAAGPGSNIYIFQNTYNESPIIFNKRGTIRSMGNRVIIQ